jgi:hypothetical protein
LGVVAGLVPNWCGQGSSRVVERHLVGHGEEKKALSGRGGFARWSDDSSRCQNFSTMPPGRDGGVSVLIVRASAAARCRRFKIVVTPPQWTTRGMDLHPATHGDLPHRFRRPRLACAGRLPFGVQSLGNAWGRRVYEKIGFLISVALRPAGFFGRSLRRSAARSLPLASTSS